MDSENPSDVLVPETSRFEPISQNFGLILPHFCDNGHFSAHSIACTNAKMHIDY